MFYYYFDKFGLQLQCKGEKSIYKWNKLVSLYYGIFLVAIIGEAEFVNDIPESRGQLYGALVLAEQANATITNIDTSQALVMFCLLLIIFFYFCFPAIFRVFFLKKMEGVVAFFSAKDIPGRNVFTTTKYLVPHDEEVCMHTIT